MADCLELLSDADGYRARCTQERYTEHSHHDHTAREASQSDLAECAEDCHDWDVASAGVRVCDICHVVREVDSATL